MEERRHSEEEYVSPSSHRLPALRKLVPAQRGPGAGAVRKTADRAKLMLHSHRVSECVSECTTHQQLLNVNVVCIRIERGIFFFWMRE